MKLTLLENGLNSLELGMKFYSMYLKEDQRFSDGTSNLKLAVICIHNAVEILGKCVLSEINELLIYKDISNQILLESLNEEHNKKYTTEEYLLSMNANIATIDYNECLKRLKGIFGSDRISRGQYQYLELIGDIRNRISHFGINKKFELHKVLAILNNALEFIIGFYAPILSKNDETNYFQFIGTGSLISEGKIREEEVWASYTQGKFEEINEIISVFSIDGFELDFEIEDEYKLINIIHICDFVNQIYLSNNLMLDSTSFQVNEMVVAIVDHLEPDNPIYILKEPIRWDEYQYSHEKFWKNERGEKSRKVKEVCALTEESMYKIIKIIIYDHV